MSIQGTSGIKVGDDEGKNEWLIMKI